MADDKHYVPGDYYRMCDLTGFKVRARHTRLMWTNTYRREQSWEPRQSQDFVTGVFDDQNVPDPRPRQTDVFIGPLGTQLTANAALGANTIQVISSVRMLPGDTVTVMLDNGAQFRTVINSLPTQTSIQLFGSLPGSASINNPVLDWTAYAQPSIG